MVAVEPLGFGRPPRMTDEEWENLPEDEEGELVDGVLVEEEVADLEHEVVVSWLIKTLSNWVDPRGGLVAGSEVKYILRPGRGRKPDISVIFPGQKPRRRGALRKPADVVIEVISPSPRDTHRDRFEKFGEYAVFGVRYYWLVDPPMKMLEIYELNEQGRYGRVSGAGAGKLEDIPGCEGLVIDLDELWSRLDRLEADEMVDDDADSGDSAK